MTYALKMSGDTYDPFNNVPLARVESIGTSQLEALLRSSETILEERTVTDAYKAGDCPCPCPPIVTAAIYVTFSPIS